MNSFQKTSERLIQEYSVQNGRRIVGRTEEDDYVEFEIDEVVVTIFPEELHYTPRNNDIVVIRPDPMATDLDAMVRKVCVQIEEYLSCPELMEPLHKRILTRILRLFGMKK